MNWPDVPNGAEFEWQPDPCAHRYYGFKMMGARNKLVGYLFNSREHLIDFRNPYLADWIHEMSASDMVQCRLAGGTK